MRNVAASASILPWSIVNPNLADPDRGELLRLSDVYTDLDTTDLRRMDREEELRDFLAHIHEMERVPAQEAVDAAACLLILGDPGSGKSTFTKHLAYSFARAAGSEEPALALAALEPWTHGWLLPVRVELRDVAAYAVRAQRNADASLLRAFLHDQLHDSRNGNIWSWLGEALDDPQQPVLLLFDGLDEVPREQRQQVVDMVHGWRHRHKHHRLVVTCRPYAYVGQPWRLQGFREVTLAPFSEAQISRFVANWYLRLAGLDRMTLAKAEQSRDQLQGALRRSDLHSLAERPLLLTVMAQLHSFTGQLPEDRTQLYADAVNLLLLRWESRIGANERTLLQQLDVPGLKLSDLEAGLYAVAYHAHAANPGQDGDTADVDEAELCKWLRPYLGGSYDKAEQFMLYIRERAGLLIRRKSESYTFPHRTFQEFLAACHLTGLLDYPREASARMREDYDRWREVFVLAAGHAARTQRLGQAIAAVNALCPFDPPPEEERATDPADWLRADVAGQALLEIGLVGVQREPDGQAVYSRVRSWLAQAVRRNEVLVAKQRVAAGVTLARLGDPRSDVVDPMAIQFCFVPAGPFVMGGEGEPAYEHDLTYSFWICRFPVTNAQYQKFVAHGGYSQEEWWVEASSAGLWDNERFDGRQSPVVYSDLSCLSNHPVVGITWYEALAFARWVERRYHEAAVLPPGYRVRLPNEPEWEKAARGGLRVLGRPLIGTQSISWHTLSTEVLQPNPSPARIYPWGNRASAEYANYGDTRIFGTSAVGCFGMGVSPYGVEELSGNVWEWTRSMLGDFENNRVFRYPYESSDGRECAPLSNSTVIARGGAFSFGDRDINCTIRVGNFPGDCISDNGFRVVLVPSSVCD